MQRAVSISAVVAGLLFASTSVAQGHNFEISSPLDFQVFQRDTAATGLMHFSGLAPVDSGLLVLIEGTGLDGPLARHWHKLKVNKPDGTFATDIRISAGGFYIVTFACSPRHAPKQYVTVRHVGIGEVFVIAGQSNSTNYGEELQTVQSGLVSTFDGKSWRIADDPQPGTQDNSKKGSFAPAFGDAMVSRFHVPIGIASVGHGSTSVRQWLPAGTPVFVMPTMTKFITHNTDGALVSDGTLYRGLLERINELGPHGFRALLWHQGESDTHQPPEHEISPDTYAQMMTQLIKATRHDAKWDFPWFVAQASYHSPTDTSSPGLRSAQRSLWESGVAFEGPDTDTLTGSNRQNDGKGVHFSAQGLQAHGRMWAEKVSVYLDRVLRESDSTAK